MSRRKLSLLCCILSLYCTAQFMNVRSWKKTERDSLDLGLLLFEEKKPLQALPIFEQILSNHPGEEFLKYSYAKCALVSVEKQAEAYRHLREVFEKNRKAPDIQYYMALAAYYNNSYDEAMTHIATYLASKRLQPEARHGAESLKKYIGYARFQFTHPTRAKIYNLGSGVNSEFDESIPAISADESLLIYTYTGPKNRPATGAGREDYAGQAYRMRRQEGELTAPQGLDELNRQGFGTVLSLSSDGSMLFLYRESGDDRGDIYYSRAQGETFTRPRRLAGGVNTAAREGACSLSPDGQTLYFSSDRPGSKGGRDIYRASLGADSSWVNVVNLGDSVNTALDEDAPFMHADGKTLFFSSKGHGNMGGYDIFKATFAAKDSSFRRVENLGYPVNSPGDELYFVMSAGAENAYFASNRREGSGRSDVYHVEPNFRGFKPSLCLLKGKVLKNGKPVSASIKIEQSSGKKKLFGTLSTDAMDGDYLVALPTGAEYQLTYSIGNYKQKTIIVDLADMTGFVEKNKNISFDAVMDSIKVPAPESVSAVTKSVEPVAITLPVPETAPGKTPGPSPVITKTVETETLLGKMPEPVTAKKQVSGKTVTVTPEPVRTESVSGAVVKNDKKEELPAVKEAKENASTQKPVTVKDTLKETPPKMAALSAVESNTIAAKKESTLNAVPLKKEEPAALSTSVVAAPVRTFAPAKEMATVPVKKGAEAPAVKLPEPVLKQPKDNNSLKELAESREPVYKAKIHPAGDGFEPNNSVQEKMMMNAFRYGDISYDSLEFRVQVSAFKNNKHYFFPKLEKFGKIDKLELGDGYKRLMLGGSFKTYGRAFAYAKKIIKAGHEDVFIVVVYKGYRYSVEDLEEVGIFK